MNVTLKMTISALFLPDTAYINSENSTDIEMAVGAATESKGTSRKEKPASWEESLRGADAPVNRRRKTKERSWQDSSLESENSTLNYSALADPHMRRKFS